MNLTLVVILVIAAGLAFYFYQQTSQTLSRLKSEGFSVDQELASNPRIVIDRQQRQLALIYAKSYELIDFDQVVSADYQIRPGDDDRPQRQIVIELQNHSKGSVTVKGSRESETDRWIQTLKHLD